MTHNLICRSGFIRFFQFGLYHFAQNPLNWGVLAIVWQSIHKSWRKENDYKIEHDNTRKFQRSFLLDAKGEFSTYKSQKKPGSNVQHAVTLELPLVHINRIRKYSFLIYGQLKQTAICGPPYFTTWSIFAVISNILVL